MSTNPEWATALARRICSNWRGGPSAAEWADFLATLDDEGAAGTTFIRLRNTSEHPPTIARFRGEYATLDTTDAGNRAAPCPLCDDTGWLLARDLVLTDHKGGTRTYSQVNPCDCREGRHRAASRTWTQRSRT